MVSKGPKQPGFASDCRKRTGGARRCKAAPEDSREPQMDVKKPQVASGAPKEPLEGSERPKVVEVVFRWAKILNEAPSDPRRDFRRPPTASKWRRRSGQS